MFHEVCWKGKNPTECGSVTSEEDLLSLETLRGTTIADGEKTASGIDNEADLILSRGAGIFDWWRRDLTKKIFCPHHHAVLSRLGRHWNFYAKQKILGKRKDLACTIPVLPGVEESHEESVFAKKNLHLAKSASEAILEQKEVLVPVGAGE